MQFDWNDPFTKVLLRFTATNTYNKCATNIDSCLFCNGKKTNIFNGPSSKASYLHIGCFPLRTTEEQNELLSKAYNLEHGFETKDPGGILHEFISKVNDDFQEAVEKLAVQANANILAVTSQFDASVLDSSGIPFIHLYFT